jgi:hypothetical protein
MTSATTESGNVLIFILIAVILFAALSFAFTQTQQGGQGAQSTLSEGQASLKASRIMDFINDVDNKVASFKTLSDCDPANEEVSFDVPSPESGGSNEGADTNAPSDKSCHIFFQEGGGINANKLADDGNTPRQWGLAYEL